MNNMEFIGETSKGRSVFRQRNCEGGFSYWLDSIPGGLVVLDTSMVTLEELEICIRAEKTRIQVEKSNKVLNLELTKDQADLLRQIVATNGGGVHCSQHESVGATMQELYNLGLIQSQRGQSWRAVHTRAGLDWVRAHPGDGEKKPVAGAPRAFQARREGG